MVIAIVIFLFIIGCRIWWVHYQRNEIWERYVWGGCPIKLNYPPNKNNPWRHEVGKNIVEVRGNQVKIQHIGWIDKDTFLRNAIHNERGLVLKMDKLRK